LGELLVVDEAHALGDPAEHFVRALLLFFQQDLELVVADEPEVDEDLTDASNGQGESSARFSVFGVRFHSTQLHSNSASGFQPTD
jgi:hypothetical protein